MDRHQENTASEMQFRRLQINDIARIIQPDATEPA